MTILLIVVILCLQMSITIKLLLLRTDTRLRYHYFRYGNKGVRYKLMKNRPMLMTHPSKNIHLLYIYIYQFYNCDPSLEQSMGYNQENNFVQTFNVVVSVITFLSENRIAILKETTNVYNICTHKCWGKYLNSCPSIGSHPRWV